MLSSDVPHDLNSAIIFFLYEAFLFWQEVNLVHLQRKILLWWCCFQCAMPLIPNPVWEFLTHLLGIIQLSNIILQPALFLPVWAFTCAVLLSRISFHLVSLVNPSFSFQGTPPKPPRRQGGWAEESSSKYVPTPFSRRPEGCKRAPWSFWVMRY